MLLVLLLPCMAAAEETAVSLLAPAETIRPGKAILLTYTVPTDGTADLSLRDAQGNIVMSVLTGQQAVAGANMLWWNGTANGVSAPEGVYQLVLTFGAEESAATVVVGAHAPYMTSIAPVKDYAAKTVSIDFYASTDGLLTVGLWADNVWSMLENRDVAAGMNAVTWDASTMPEGATALTLTLTDETGFSSNEEHIAVSAEEFGIVFATPTPAPTATPEPSAIPTAEPTIAPIDMDEDVIPELAVTAEPTANPEPTAAPTPFVIFTPSYGSVTEEIPGEAPNYWNTPMDITDEDAIWAMLTSPFHYINRDLDGQARVYAAPDEDSRVVAVVTGKSQGVRIIEERDDGWTKIELYSSTFHDNSINAWNMLVQGYVKSSLIKTKEMNDRYHIIVDKLTQRLYLFGDGELKSTLLVSTGLSNEGQPYNETRSGDFIYISPSGGFRSDNMYCPLALKFNDGDLLHEVPYIDRGSGKIYSATEPYLGQRASHGCIRVQRKKTPEGINMQWFWNNRKELGRIVVWEDWQGRQVAYPADDTVLYYNPKGGSYYHRGEKCFSAKDSVVFSTFTYAELDSGDYAELEACPYCVPEMRRALIDEINAAHAFGGDHDPVLTEARMKYLRDIPYEELTLSELRYWVDEEAKAE